MFNFKRALSALLILTICTGLIVGPALIIASAITQNLTHTAIGATTLILSLALTAGLNVDPGK